MKKVLAISILILGFIPLLASAATVPSGDLISILSILGPIIRTLSRLAFAVALFGFFWGMTMFIWNVGNEKKRTEGRSIMIYGVLVLFVALSIFGIVGGLQNTFQIQNVHLQIPCPTVDQNC